MRGMRIWMTAALLFATLPVDAAPINGVALALYYESPEQGMRFETMVDEIAELGASHVSVLVQWSQVDTKSSVIQPHPKETPADSVVRQVITRAKSRGLKVMLFPILWVERRAIGDWRGTLRPTQPIEWWANYRRFIMHYADLAAQSGVDMFSVGSELGSMESQETRWRQLVAEVRQRFQGELLYSANWDHYQHVTFWDAVDYVGLTGYYALTRRKNPSLAELRESWSRIRLQLLDWHSFKKRPPLLFTEIGYPSVDGAAAEPWNYVDGRQIDLAEQALCFQAFYDVWAAEKRLAGVFFWNWWGPADGQNTWYTLKGKPALKVVESWVSRDKIP